MSGSDIDFGQICPSLLYIIHFIHVDETMKCFYPDYLSSDGVDSTDD